MLESIVSDSTIRSPLHTRRPSAWIVWAGAHMNRMLRPNVPDELRHRTVDVQLARSDTVAYVEAFLVNDVDVHLLGVPLETHAFTGAIGRLLEQFSGRLTVHRHEEFARWLNTPPGADGVFPEDWGRLRFSPRDGLLYFVSSHMSATSRIGEHNMGVSTAVALGLIDCSRIIHILERDPLARCETGDILELMINGKPVTIFGLSERSNSEGFTAWRSISEDHWFGEVFPAAVFPKVGLHLTTATGALDDETVLYDPTMVSVRDLQQVPGIRLVEIHPRDRGRQNVANCIRFRSTNRIGMDNRFAPTMDRVSSLGYDVVPLPNDQHRIGAGGLTCRSLRDWFAIAHAQRLAA